MRRLGIVDLGSNTARLVVFGYEPGRSFRLLDGIRETIRLGEGLASSGRLSDTAVERGLSALRLFADYARGAGLAELQVAGTSALRDAANKDEFLAASRRLGLEIEVLTGDDEARLGTLAVANSFDLEDAWVMDLGGGSAQISHLERRRFAGGAAYPLGAVRLTEAHLASDPPAATEVAELEARVEEELAEVADRLAASPVPLVAMGGTVRNLARAVQKRDDYPLEQMHGYFLRRDDLEALTEELLARGTKKRAKVRGIHPERSDIIVAGALVYRWLLRRSRRDGLLISGLGVREGLLYRHLLPPPHLVYDVRTFAVDNFLSQFAEPTPHLKHVRKLAGRLFRQLRPLHGLGPAEAQLLDAAALLHDVGGAISYYRHHRHGAYLVESSPLNGFSHREQALLILLMRYHHSGNPRLRQYAPLCRDGDKELLTRLACCLRLAEYLERSQAQRVEDAEVAIGDEVVTIRLRAEVEPTVEIEETRKLCADLFQRAFDRRMELVAG